MNKFDLLKEGEKFTDDMVKGNKDRFLVKKKSQAFGKYIKPGAMIHFQYDAKYKDTLKFWDSMPTIIVLRVTKTRMLGLNLHFVPTELRKNIIKFIINKNSSNIKRNKPMYIDYKTIKSFLNAINATICIRSYLVNRIKRNITIVQSHKDYVIGATSLKTSKIYKMSQSEIYKIALGKDWDKKKTGSRRFKRRKIKRAMKK